MTSFRKGEISVDPKTQFRRVYDGTKWRRLCSVDHCLKRVQIRGLCARHLRESQRSDSDAIYLPNGDDQCRFTGQTPPLLQRRESIDSYVLNDLDEMDLSTSPTMSSSPSTNFSPPQEQPISNCQYRISLDDKSGCSEDVSYRCNHCSLGFCYAHAFEHRQYVQAMYHYLQDKESFKHSMTVMTTNDYGGEKKLTTNARQNFADRRFYDTSNNSNQPDPLGDLMDWLEEQETSRHTDAVRIKAEIKSEDNDDFFRHATSTNRIVETAQCNCKITDDRVNMNMSKQQLTDDDVRIIAMYALENSERIQSLDCSNNQISEKGVAYLSEALRRNQTVTSLNLRNNEIQDLGLQHLCLALQFNNTLTHLDISNNRIHFCSMHYLGQALACNQTLIALDLGHNLIESSGMRALSAGLLRNQSLKSLDLRCNQIDFKGIRYLSEALKVNRTLASLNLAYNFIGNTGARHLAQALQTNNVLLDMNVHCTGIGDEGMAYLRENLQNTSIEICGETSFSG